MSVRGVVWVWAGLWGCDEGEPSTLELRLDSGASDSGGDGSMIEPMPPPSSPNPELLGLSADGGTLLWTPSPGEWVLETMSSGNIWRPVAFGTGPWWVDMRTSNGMFRLWSGSAESLLSEPLQPPRLSLSLSLEHDLLLSGEALAGSLQVTRDQEPLAGAPAQDLWDPMVAGQVTLELSRSSIHSPPQWMDGDCLEKGLEVDTCWVSTPASLQAWQLPTLSADDLSPQQWTLEARLAAHVRGETVILAERAVSYVGLASQVAYGDLHAHSNLSHDGCETLDTTCSSRGAQAAEDFFANANAQNLDFAAITDHAESDTYQPQESQSALDIWQAQQDVVVQASAGGVVPLIGYEWSAALGHRSVIFEDATPCEQVRVPGLVSLPDRLRRPAGDVFYGSERSPVVLPADLWTALDEGLKVCHSPGRSLTIPHHPAMRIPTPVLWSNSVNIPDMNHERLVEIASEHGTSECVDMEQPFCAWRLKEGVSYVSAGSFQAALLEGYRLGVVGGTDSHDSRPGSLDDGPSCISQVNDNGDFACHDYGGSLTGVWYTGPLDRTGLFDALYARHTFATTGPRPDLRVVLRSPSGEVFLPGDDVPLTATVLFQLDVDLRSIASEDILGVDLIAADGEIRQTWSDVRHQEDLLATPGEILYLRLRLLSDGIEERMWLSPFFFG